MNTPYLTRRGLGAAALATAFATTARAQSSPSTAALDEITVASTPAGADAPICVAIEQGMFARAGLSVKMVLIPLMPNLPPAIVSGSAQIGFLTAPTFLQAVDGGLDLVAVCGGAVTDQKVHDIAILSRPDENLTKASDFIGKSVGVPGIGAFFHVMFRYWLMERGVDPAKVTYLEVAFPSMGDALRGKTVDAVLAIDPFLSAITASGAAKIAVPIAQELPSGKPEVFFCATREYVQGHARALTAFHRAMTEACAAVNKDRELGVTDLVKYVKMPPQVLPHVVIETLDTHLDVAGLQWWVETMSKQNLLSRKLDIPKLLWQPA